MPLPGMSCYHFFFFFFAYKILYPFFGTSTQVHLSKIPEDSKDHLVTGHQADYVEAKLHLRNSLLSKAGIWCKGSFPTIFK